MTMPSGSSSERSVGTFTASRHIRQVTATAGGDLKTTTRTIREPIIEALLDGGRTGYLQTVADLPLGEQARRRLVDELGARTAVAREPRGTGPHRRCPGPIEPQSVDVEAFFTFADRQGMPMRRLSVLRHEAQRQFRTSAQERVCVHTWSSLTAEPADGRLPAIDIHFHGPVRWGWLLEELSVLVPNADLPKVRLAPGHTVLMIPTATVAMVGALTSACLRSSGQPQPASRFLLRTCETDPDVPFGHCFDLDGTDTSSIVLSGPRRVQLRGRGSPGLGELTGHNTTRPYAPIPVARPTAVSLIGEDDASEDGSPLADYTGAVVTSLAEHGAGHLLEGAGFFVRAHGLVMERGVVTGRWGPLTLAQQVGDVLSHLLRVRADGSYTRTNEITVPRLWADLRMG